MIYPLRDYQKNIKQKISNHFKNGTKKVILCSPTGSGKTVTFADIARDTVKNGFRVMVCVDRKELLDQACDKLIAYGLIPNKITSGRGFKNGKKCYVATVQTLVRREFPDIDLLIIDEAHKQIFDKLIIDDGFYKNTYIIGATATPIRKGKMNQLSDMYEHIVEETTISQLIKEGFLTPAITYAAKLDKSSIKIKRGDYDMDQMYSMFDKRVRYDGVVEKYKKFGDKTKAICFNVNVQHSKKVTQAFINAGYKSAHIDGSMSKGLRESILRNFSMGMIDVLNNVEVLTTGYDEWSIETVIVNRATKSLPLWLQMCGRGSRIVPSELNIVKDHFNIIDMGGNVFEHGFWDQSRKFKLTHTRKNDEGVAPVKSCQICEAIVHASASICDHCGYIFPKKQQKLEKSEFTQIENFEFLPQHLVGKSWSSMSFDELEEVKKIKGYKHGWIVKQILLSDHLNLIDYASFKKYKHPQAWVNKMKQIYLR